MTVPFATSRPAEHHDVLAPDGSEIRFLPQVEGGSMVHCTLPAGAVSLAVTHRTVDELWYVLSGEGELWRRQGGREEIVDLLPHTAHSIPLGTWFQFRNPGRDPLTLVIVTMPPWPGMDEAVRVEDHWRQARGWKLGVRTAASNDCISGLVAPDKRRTAPAVSSWSRSLRSPLQHVQ